MNSCNKNAWKIMLMLSIIFIIWTLFVMSRGAKILPTAFQLAGSPQQIEDIEKNALAFMNMSMLKPLWEELWIGIFKKQCPTPLPAYFNL